jgi:hypothetical protein
VPVWVPDEQMVLMASFLALRAEARQDGQRAQRHMNAVAAEMDLQAAEREAWGR